MHLPTQYPKKELLQRFISAKHKKTDFNGNKSWSTI